MQDQIDYLKGKFVKEIRTRKINRKREIKKRQTKTPALKLQRKFENINSSCTFFYPDYPDAGLEKSKNVTIEMPKAGKEVVKKQENNKSKSMKPICEHSTPFCTYTHPDHRGVGSKIGNNNTTIPNNQTTQDTTEVNKMPTTCKDLLWEEMKVFKIQNRDQSNRIDQLEQTLKILQNTPPASITVTRDNPKDKMKNVASKASIDGQDSQALSLPSSCKDLEMLDHYLDGLYLVKNKQTKKIQTVFCKFSADDKGRMN